MIEVWDCILIGVVGGIVWFLLETIVALVIQAYAARDTRRMIRRLRDDYGYGDPR